ncbi:MAG TPA: hypothetical protein VE258_07985 [Ktedonobacterales bacterium]|nr:hypothetical protein [Ktedonobacterales bacterium]
MTLRIAAAFALLLGAAGLIAYLHLLGKSPFATLEARHLREMKDRRDPPLTTAPYTSDDFKALPHDWNVAEYSALERRGVTIEGYVPRMLRASDDDVHLEVIPGWDPAGHESAPYTTAEITPAFRRGSHTWTYESLAHAFRVSGGAVTPWDSGPRRVRISGWLLFDFQYDLRPDLRSTSADPPRLTGWEIHPVTRIEIWSDSLKAFTEFPR